MRAYLLTVKPLTSDACRDVTEPAGSGGQVHMA